MKKKTKISGQAFSYMFFSILILFFLICMLSNPQKYISKTLDGISAWAFNVLPSILPFMFFTKVLSSLNFVSKITQPFAPITKTLFKTPAVSFYTFIMAILSGYPVGSKMIADLYQQGKITKEDAFKMSSFCSTSGPMFIIGAVGIGMFKNSKIGYILFLSHIVGAILNGIIFRNLKLKNTEQYQETKSTQNIKFDLSEVITNSCLSILSVGCIITIFFVIIECFSPLFSLLPQNISFLFEGVIEITKGCIDLSALSNTFSSVIFCSFVISFGGISTILQSLTMLSKLKMPTKLFVFQKFMHGVLSCIVTTLIMLII